MSVDLVILMYHELELPGRELCEEGTGYRRYVVAATDFRAQLARLGAGDARATSVSEALAAPPGPRSVAITFDDGCETDLITAAPALAERGYGATFYVTVGRVGRSGYLATRQVRELSDLGFEIGCHSLSHAYLPGLSPTRLEQEIGESKDSLEGLTGRPVIALSCPGGRWSRRVADAARARGYESVATSRIGTVSPNADPFDLPRVAIMRDMSASDVEAVTRAQGLRARWIRAAALDAAKRVLGDNTYERLRATALGSRT
ncbi:MAG: polysaccharide deacetylase family protein [Gemmatimonadaceae bacterium]